MRIKFRKTQQRKFFDEILLKLNCPSLRLLNQFGFKINYQTLKSYYHENRTLPKELFENLCKISGMEYRKQSPISISPSMFSVFPKSKKPEGFGEKNKLNFKIINDNWGKVKGGKN